MTMTSALSADLHGDLSDIPLGADAEITRLADGGYALVAEVEDMGFSILRIFNAAGQPVRSIGLSGTDPTLAGLTDGRIAVALMRPDTMHNLFMVSSNYLTVTFSPVLNPGETNMAAGANGTFFTTRLIPYSTDTDLRLSRFFAIGTQDTVFNLENASAVTSSDSDLALLSNGNVVVTNHETTNATGETELCFYIVNPVSTISQRFTIPDSAGPGSENSHARVVATADGFAIVYSTRVFSFTELDIRMRSFDLNGTQISDRLITNTEFGNTGTDDGFDDTAPEIAAGPDGAIAVTWTRDNGGNLDQMLQLIGQGGESTVGFGRSDNPQSAPLVTYFGTGQIAAYHHDATLNAMMGQHFSGFRDSFGDAGADSFTGDDYFDLINGLEGNDTLYGAGNNDTVQGGDGRDSLYGGDGNDEMVGEEGVGAQSAGNHSDWMSGGNGNDFLNGETGNDTLLGDAGTDVLAGGSGNDSLNGGANGDTLSGGEGADTLTGDGGRDSLQGDNGNDFLYGGGTGVTDAGDHDTLDGGAGNDSMAGGTGNDFMVGGTGVDTMDGGTGNDTMDGGVNGDSLSGGDGHDSLIGGAGNDTLSGNVGNDHLDGQDNNDSLNGDSGNDTILGGAGADQMSGGTEQDVLGGGTGNDTMNGGDNQDTLEGGEGLDALTGGGGNDRFIFTSGLAADADTIADFESLADKLVLAGATFAALGVQVNSTELRFGAAALDGNDYLLYVQATGVLLFDADADGGGAAQLLAQLAPATVLKSGDFLIL